MLLKEDYKGLREIKKGETGEGLLIEHDGFVSLEITQHNKQLKESVDGHDGWYVPKPFIVDCVLQKFGIKNANGRIYPEDVLKSQVEEYQQVIAERRALGECYKPDALILTEEGWKTLEDVKEGENVLTLNVETKEIEIHPIYEKVEYDFDGDMIHIFNSEINDVVTPDHKFITFKEDNDEFNGRVSANEILNGEYEEGSYIPMLVNDKFDKCCSLSKKDVNVEKIPYKGKVICVKVENHNFYVMCNGKAHWTSNYCNHPADSTIDLGRISHNIIECHWEGHTLVGKLELNISEGFRKLGICSTLGDTCAQLLLNGWKIGISSRGVGEVKERLGTTYVTEYQLIGWDIVSQPSSPGAWLTTNGKEDLQQYVESKNNDSVLSEKIDRLENILND